MAQKTIHPTKHAIDRFAQRVLPHLPKKSRNKMKKKDRIKQSLYRLIRRTEITGKEGVAPCSNLLYHPRIRRRPLTLVIDFVNRTLPLYISPIGRISGTMKIQNGCGANESTSLAVNWHFWPWCNYGCKFCFARFEDIPVQIASEGNRDIVPEMLAEAGADKITVGGEPTLCHSLATLCFQRC